MASRATASLLPGALVLRARARASVISFLQYIRLLIIVDTQQGRRTFIPMKQSRSIHWGGAIRWVYGLFLVGCTSQVAENPQPGAVAPARVALDRSSQEVYKGTPVGPADATVLPVARVRRLVSPNKLDLSPFPRPFDLGKATAESSCSGVLVDPSWVLTAAHCADPSPEMVTRGIEVTFARRSKFQTSGVAVQKIPIERTKRHPKLDALLVHLVVPLYDRVPPSLARKDNPFGAVQCFGFGQDVAAPKAKCEARTLKSCTMVLGGMDKFGQLILTPGPSKQFLDHGDSGGGCFQFTGVERELVGLTVSVHDPNNKLQCSGAPMDVQADSYALPLGGRLHTWIVETISNVENAWKPESGIVINDGSDPKAPSVWNGYLSDLDGNGLTDFVSVSDKHIWSRLGQGAATLGALQRTDLDPWAPTRPELTAFVHRDADALLDWVEVKSDRLIVRNGLAQSPGRFGPGHDEPLNGNDFDLTPLDDGLSGGVISFQPLTAVAQGHLSVAWVGNQQVRVAPASATGAFGGNVTFSPEPGDASLQPWYANQTFADVDGDGVADFVRFFQGAVFIMLGDGAGGFVAPPDGQGPWVELKQFFISEGTQPALGDVNADKRADLLYVLKGGIVTMLADPSQPGRFSAPKFSLSSYFDDWRGSGCFASPAADGTYYCAGLWADVNGDGLLDAVDIRDRRIWWRLGDGLGGFGEVRSTSMGIHAGVSEGSYVMFGQLDKTASGDDVGIFTPSSLLPMLSRLKPVLIQ